MRIALAQINPTIGDFAGNRRLIVAATKQAVERRAELVVFPELAVCGYPPMDLLDHPSFVDENLRSLRALQHDLPPDIGVIVGYVDKSRSTAGKPLMNAASLLYAGGVTFTQGKSLLPTYDVFDEARYFEPALRRNVVAFRDTILGIAICEDMWWETEPTPGVRYPVDPVRDLLDQGARVIIAPSASPFHADKMRVRSALAAKIGRSSGVPVVYTNMVGGNDNLIFDGHSFVTDCNGAVVHQSAAFVESLDVVDVPQAGPSATGVAPSRPVQVAIPPKYEQIAGALALGVRDYLRKTGFKRVHLGLSGGVDSALVATIAADAVGPSNVTGFLMPSQYSSSGSITDSEALARNLGIAYHTLPIRGVYDAFEAGLEPVFAGTTPDLAEENIQARIRGTLLMAYSNKFGSLLLTTGNKSELGVGYCTLYGDMAGSLAVIGDLFKTEVYELCRWYNRHGEVIPEPILTKAPSAELRPDQKDQDSLPEYAILDAILRRYLLGNLAAPEIIAQGYDTETVVKVLRLVAQSEYKRRQAPPVLKVSPRAFGTGRRMPIARRIYEA